MFSPNVILYLKKKPIPRPKYIMASKIARRDESMQNFSLIKDLLKL
jgi:hypothetical protein